MLSKYYDKYNKWHTIYHETFSCEKQFIISELNPNNINNDTHFRNNAGMFIELTSDYQLVRCGISDNIGNKINNVIRTTNDPSNLLLIKSYYKINKDDTEWHYWLGIAKQNLKKMLT